MSIYLARGRSNEGFTFTTTPDVPIYISPNMPVEWVKELF